ncbi:unnamed protein product [Cylindrotheca closterium]|uniref:Uncharacterized protein n=1 Tax=Cylindrotheca closterium TaxID=2856 RepID=A0AAD2G5B8_9STRA|nr:unnamed protein product [Cylindrotheca closterium]
MSNKEGFHPASTLDTFDDEVLGYAIAGDAAVATPIHHEAVDQGIRPIVGGNDARNRSNHLFCGCCCDSRRATIVVNMIAIIWYTVMIIVFAFLGVSIAENGFPGDEENNAQQDGGDFDDEGRDVFFEGEALAAVIISTVSIALHVFGIYGAIYYQSAAVAASAFGYMFSFALALLSLNMTGIILCSLFFYAHAILLLEIRNGIMTPYNYENIKACCECNF